MPESESTAAETSFAKDLWKKAEGLLVKHGQMVPGDDFIKDTPNRRIGSATQFAYIFVSGVYLSPADNPNSILRYITILGSLTPDSDLVDILALEKNLGKNLVDKPFVTIPSMQTMALSAEILGVLETEYR